MASKNEVLRSLVLYGQGSSNLCAFDTEARTLKLGGREHHNITASAQENGWLSAAGQVSKLFTSRTPSRMVELTNSGDNETYAITGLSPAVDVAGGLVSVFFFNALGELRAASTDPYVTIPATDSYIKAVTGHDPLPVLDPLAVATNAVTATSISATLDMAYATKVYAIYRTTEVEQPASCVNTGYVVINTPSSKASLRLGRSTAEAKTGLVNNIPCSAGEWYAVSFHAKALNGTPSVKIGCYDANGAAVSIVSAKLCEGNLALGGGNIVCTVGAALNRFSAALQVPTGGRYIDISIESPTSLVGGDHACFITAYMVAKTDADIPYSPSDVTYAIQRPPNVADGNAGEVLSTDGRGNIRWVPQTGGGGGGGGGISSINTLIASAQTIATGTTAADVDGISVSSDTATHTLSTANVETLATATKHGSLRKSDYDVFVAAATRINPPSGDRIFDSGLQPATDNAHDLGTDTKRWRKLYAVDIDFTGALTKNGVTFAPEESAQIYSMFWS